MKGWYRGTLKDSLFELDKGETVIVCESYLTHKSIAKTYWVIGIKKKKMYHVADTFAGSGCKHLVSIEREAKDQNLCAGLAIKLFKPEQFQSFAAVKNPPTVSGFSWLDACPVN